MNRNRPVPIVNNAGEAVTFERQTADNASRGTVSLGPGRTHYEPGVTQTYETLVLKDRRGKFTNEVITMDELADDTTFERIEVIRDPDHDFKLKRHLRKTFVQKLSDWNPLKSRSRGGTLPT